MWSRTLRSTASTPKENYIQIVLSSQFKLDNKDGVAEALKKMVRYYPKPEYWENLTDIYRRKQNSDRVTLGFYRLMSDVGVLKDKGDYTRDGAARDRSRCAGRSRADHAEGHG